MSFAKWLRLPSGIAVLFGIGALSTAATQSAMAEPGFGKSPLRVPQQSAKSFGEVLIWTDSGRIYVSENGKPAQELRLGDTPEAAHLRALLEREGAIATSPHVLQHRMILVGGGGAAVHWGSAQPSNGADISRGPAPRDPHRAANPPARRQSGQMTNPDTAKVARTQKQD